MQPEAPLTCSDFDLIAGVPPCCVSCHEGADEGYEDLSGDGENFRVCCHIARWLADHGVVIYAALESQKPRSAFVEQLIRIRAQRFK